LTPEQEVRARWDMDSLETIEKISKPCPNCKTKIERDGKNLNLLKCLYYSDRETQSK